MSWLYESKKYESEKNGTINCTRFLGNWKILVDGVQQTSLTMTGIWRKAFKYIPKKSKIKNVLFLGFGGGGSIEELYKRFGKVNVTVVEYDEVMVEISKKLELFKKNHTPRIIIADAYEAIEKLDEKFDLILVDLFSGGEPSLLLKNEMFLKSLQKRLERRGYILVNVFLRKDYLVKISNYFSKLSYLKIRFNNIGLYRHFGNGQIYDPLPEGFIHPQQNKKYIQSELLANFVFDFVEGAGPLGIRWHFGPVWFEEYISEIEPKIEKNNHLRLVTWRQIGRAFTPIGWRRFWSNTELVKQTGFAEITNPEKYWENWDESARRYRNKFLSSQLNSIKEVSLDEFISFFPNEGKYRKFNKRVQVKLSSHFKFNKDNTHFFLAQKSGTGEIVGGLAVTDLPEIKYSVHLAAFIKPQEADSSVGVGLIDHWFKHSIENNIRFLDFGVFHTHGDNYSWKGFSDFKSKFGIYFIRYPITLFKIVMPNFNERNQR